MPYDERWPSEFDRIAMALRREMGELALRIDHIGSTAVPGLAAKDIIDVQVTVATLDAAVIGPVLAPLGYTLHGGFVTDHVPPGWDATAAEWEKLYCQIPAGHRPAHIHIRAAGRANQRYALLFRDYLRAAPSAAAAYGLIKEALARLHPDDEDAYYDVKDPVCDLLVDAAARWAAVTGYAPASSDR